MARLRGHKTLDATQPLYVKRTTLTFGGRTFQKGDLLDWKALDIAPRKLHQMWFQRLIGHEKPDEQNGAENPGDLVKPIAVPADTRIEMTRVSTGESFHVRTPQQRRSRRPE